MKRGKTRVREKPGDEPYSIYQDGERKYLNATEARQIKETIQSCDPERRLLILFLYYTGCRISEALEVTPARFDLDSNVVGLRTLKQKNRDTWRRIVLPETFIKDLLLTLYNSYIVENNQLSFVSK